MISRNEFYKICRVCGGTDGISLNLFTEAGKGYLFKVQKLLSKNISKDDNLPKNICGVCTAYVADFDKFRKHFETVQIKLNNISCNLQPGTNPCRIPTTKNLRSETASTSGNVNDRSHQEPSVTSQNCDSERIEENASEIKKEHENEEWSVHVVKGTNSTNRLHICKRCEAVIVVESAVSTHECETPSNRLPQPQECSAKKRKRIISEGDDD